MNWVPVPALRRKFRIKDEEMIKSEENFIYKSYSYRYF